MLTTITLVLALSSGACRADSVAPLIRQHLQWYPGLDVQDVYKLLFQGEFGVGHILADERHVRTYLDNEMVRLDTAAGNEQLLEPVSPDGEMVRVNLRPFNRLGLSRDSLVRAMLISAERTVPDTSRFVARWEEFVELARRGGLHFENRDLETWAARAHQRPVPLAHHSVRYTQQYKPAYRVCRRDVFEQLFAHAARGKP